MREKRDCRQQVNYIFISNEECQPAFLSGNKKKKSSVPRKKRVAPIKIIITDVDEEEVRKDKEKVKLLKSVADELCQPQR